MLYPTSVTKYYPTTAQITVWLKKAQISPTELQEGDVQMLLDMLVYSGEIEVLPRTGLRGGAVFDSDESAAEDDDHDHDESGDSDHDEKKRKRKRPASRARSSSSKVEGGDREDENEEDEIASRPVKRRRKNDQSRTRSDRGQSSDDVEFDLDFARVETFDGLGASSASGSWKGSLTGGAGVVYRALRRERMGLGWAQTPCGRCPQFDFCSDKDKGPVNPDQCKYYRDWLEAPIGEISAIDI
jgi:DNA-directed RNA polymerase III subunit RPC6